MGKNGAGNGPPNIEESKRPDHNAGKKPRLEHIIEEKSNFDN